MANTAKASISVSNPRPYSPTTRGSPTRAAAPPASAAAARPGQPLPPRGA